VILAEPGQRVGLAYDTDVQIMVIGDPGAALSPGCAGLRRPGRGDRRGCMLTSDGLPGCL
jgi:hypothetical protein